MEKLVFTIDSRDEKRILTDELIFVCPISGELFVDPVFCMGYTFERSHIAKWFENNDTHPITRKKLRPIEMILHDNFSIKSATTSFRDETAKACNLEIERFLSMFEEGECKENFVVDFEILRTLEKLFERSLEVKPNNSRTIENAIKYYPLVEQFSSKLPLEQQKLIIVSRLGHFTISKLSQEEKDGFARRFEEERTKLIVIVRKQKELIGQIPGDILSCDMDERITNLPLFFSLLLGSTENNVVDQEIAKQVYDDITGRKSSDTSHMYQIQNDLARILCPDLTGEFDELLGIMKIEKPDEEKTKEIQLIRDRFLIVKKCILETLINMTKEDYNIQVAMITLRRALAYDHQIEEKQLKSFDVICELLSVIIGLMYETGIALLKDSRRQCHEYFKATKDISLYVCDDERFKLFFRNLISRFFETCYSMERSHRFDESDCKLINEKTIIMFQKIHAGEGMVMVRESIDQIGHEIPLSHFSSFSDEKIKKEIKKNRELFGRKYYRNIHSSRFPNHQRNIGFYNRKKGISDYGTFTNYFKPILKKEEEKTEMFSWGHEDI